MSYLNKLLPIFLLLIVSFGASAQAEEIFTQEDFDIEVPDFFVRNISSEGVLTCTNPAKLDSLHNVVSIVINGERRNLSFVNNRATFEMTFDRAEPMSIKAGGFTHVQEVNPMPLWMSIIPPLLVIGLAIITKEVISSLLIGIFSGAAMAGYYGTFSGWGEGFFRIIDTYVVQAMADTGHISVIVFSVLIGGIVAVISKNGGMQGVVDLVARKATDAKRGQLTTWGLGVAIFFDDYANTLVVGNTMRPLTDKLRISREKLSYIVDSTAAPVAAIALITTWIGAELGYIEGALESINANGEQIAGGAYNIFLGSLAYAFYPVFCLAFILFLVLKNKDFGPMYHAEVKARQNASQLSEEGSSVDMSEFEPVAGVKPNALNAILPILVVVLGTVVGLFVTGGESAVWDDASLSFGKKLSITIGNSDSYVALLWSSMSGLVAAILLTVFQKIMNLRDAVDTSIDGFKTMVNAIIILILAWSLAAITDEMHTADYLAGLAAGNVSIWFIPAITFFISALVAFSTGSSWGTMAIVYPLMLPLCWGLSMQEGLEASVAMGLFLNVTSCVLSGSVLGDHCSPISDTTILSSLATQCDHLAHVRTQMPYALTVGAVAVVFTFLSSYFSIPWFVSFPAGLAILYAVVHYFGKEVPT